MLHVTAAKRKPRGSVKLNKKKKSKLHRTGTRQEICSDTEIKLLFPWRHPCKHLTTQQTNKTKKSLVPADCTLQIIPVVVRSLAATLTKPYKVWAIVSSIIKAVVLNRQTYSLKTPQTIDTDVSLQLTRYIMVAWFITFDEYFPVKSTESCYGLYTAADRHKKEASNLWNVRWCTL